MDDQAAGFVDDDRGYLSWLGRHPHGFVLNCPRGFSTKETVLHRATCSFVNDTQPGIPAGAFTERQYVKVCADTVSALREWVRSRGRDDGDFAKSSCSCHPLGEKAPSSAAANRAEKDGGAGKRAVGLTLPRPTLDYVRSRLEALRGDEEFYGAEETISLIFSRWPENRKFAPVHAKVVVLNTLYSSGLRTIDTYPMARQIVGLDIDACLRDGDPMLVRDICRLDLPRGRTVFYSFATKYCAWHEPDLFQIYDSYVDELLWAYRSRFSFHAFKRMDLGTYRKFLAVIDKFKAAFGLECLSRKETDKFLWSEGKRLRARSRREVRVPPE